MPQIGPYLRRKTPQSSSTWSRLVNAASAAQATAEASMAKLTGDFSKSLNVGEAGKCSLAPVSGGQEVCPQCNLGSHRSQLLWSMWRKFMREIITGQVLGSYRSMYAPSAADGLGSAAEGLGSYRSMYRC
ncbi:hypothetical protein RND81_09G063600 [Saponaria officinalis]|uniref:Uncharacterized protein n=1 Tax=Saponaria officinalis TaxID=3572 RepID=A0AAW1IIP2_SAPOF